MTLSWFDGPGLGFVARSQTMSESGLRMAHRPSPPAVHLHGDRAVHELPLAVERRFAPDGGEAGWKILSMNAIDECDTLTPVIPGTTLDIDHAAIAQFRTPTGSSPTTSAGAAAP